MYVYHPGIMLKQILIQLVWVGTGESSLLMNFHCILSFICWVTLGKSFQNLNLDFLMYKMNIMSINEIKGIKEMLFLVPYATSPWPTLIQATFVIDTVHHSYISH